jgi:hypothetical protein
MPKEYQVTFFKFFFIFVALFLWVTCFPPSIFAKTQAPKIEWQRSYGGRNRDNPTSAQKTLDGGYIIAGESYSNNSAYSLANKDIWIVKVDQLGKIQWHQNFGGSESEIVSSILVSEGGYIIIGASESSDGDLDFNRGYFDAWIIKLDRLGNLAFTKNFGGSNRDYFSSIQQTADGGFIVAGNSNSKDGDVTGNHGEKDFWIIKFDQQGNIQWKKCLGGSKEDVANSILITSDNGFIIAGYSQSKDGDVTENHGNADIWIVKLNTLGFIQWQKSFGGSRWDSANSILETSTGDFIIAGESKSNDGDVTENHGSHDFWIVKIDSQGNLLKQKSYGGNYSDTPYAILETSDMGFIIAGKSDSEDGDITENLGGDDIWLIEIDDQLNLRWQKNFGGSNDEAAVSILDTLDEGFIIVGPSSSYDGDVRTKNHGTNDFWFVKFKR